MSSLPTGWTTTIQKRSRRFISSGRGRPFFDEPTLTAGECRALGAACSHRDAPWKRNPGLTRGQAIDITVAALPDDDSAPVPTILSERLVCLYRRTKRLPRSWK